MDKEQIRKALDHFENDQFTDAKEILTKEIRNATIDHLNKKLNLKEGWEVSEQEKEDEDEDEKDEDEDEDEDKVEESSTDDAKKTLDAILGALESGDKPDPKNEILKMARGMRDSFKKNGGFSPDQAKWIYNTSKAMFK